MVGPIVPRNYRLTITTDMDDYYSSDYNPLNDMYSCEYNKSVHATHILQTSRRHNKIFNGLNPELGLIDTVGYGKNKAYIVCDTNSIDNSNYKQCFEKSSHFNAYPFYVSPIMDEPTPIMNYSHLYIMKLGLKPNTPDGEWLWNQPIFKIDKNEVGRYGFDNEMDMAQAILDHLYGDLSVKKAEFTKSEYITIIKDFLATKLIDTDDANIDLEPIHHDFVATVKANIERLRDAIISTDPNHMEAKWKKLRILKTYVITLYKLTKGNLAEADAQPIVDKIEDHLNGNANDIDSIDNDNDDDDDDDGDSDNIEAPSHPDLNDDEHGLMPDHVNVDNVQFPGHIADNPNIPNKPRGFNENDARGARINSTMTMPEYLELLSNGNKIPSDRKTELVSNYLDAKTKVKISPLDLDTIVATFPLTNLGKAVKQIHFTNPLTFFERIPQKSKSFCTWANGSANVTFKTQFNRGNNNQYREVNDHNNPDDDDDGIDFDFDEHHNGRQDNHDPVLRAIQFQFVNDEPLHFKSRKEAKFANDFGLSLHVGNLGMVNAPLWLWVNADPELITPYKFNIIFQLFFAMIGSSSLWEGNCKPDGLNHGFMWSPTTYQLLKQNKNIRMFDGAEIAKLLLSCSNTDWMRDALGNDEYDKNANWLPSIWPKKVMCYTEYFPTKVPIANGFEHTIPSHSTVYYDANDTNQLHIDSNRGDPPVGRLTHLIPPKIRWDGQLVNMPGPEKWYKYVTSDDTKDKVNRGDHEPMWPFQDNFQFDHRNKACHVMMYMGWSASNQNGHHTTLDPNLRHTFHKDYGTFIPVFDKTEIGIGLDCYLPADSNGF